MPEFFPFIPGSEESSSARTQRAAAGAPDNATPLLGRFRAHNHQRQARRYRSLANLGGGGRGSVHVGYGALLLAAAAAEDSEYSDSDSDDDGEATWGTRVRRRFRDLWVSPRQGAVRRVVDKWWSRWAVLVVLPAGLAVAWCAIPFPKYPLDDGVGPALHSSSPPNATRPAPPLDHRAPGHGEARVQVNFWFFLFVYYGFYNLTALIWITKLFNLYSLNWWPSALGFPLTISIIAVASLTAPIPLYLIPEARFLLVHNTAWVTWTFMVMGVPVTIAIAILLAHNRHHGLRHALSDTQRIFTSSWWTGDDHDSLHVTRDYRAGKNGNYRRPPLGLGAFDPDAPLLQDGGGAGGVGFAGVPPPLFTQPRRLLPASFVRFMWFCLALAISLLAYLLGETYAEIYLRTLPHDSVETVAYVYSWVVTVHLLDAAAGWILGAADGARVGSYPLAWIFKLYFVLTYQTYVRALYARLRSPQQFVWLQALSSASVVLFTPLTMTRAWHRGLAVLGLGGGDSYSAYKKLRMRDVFVRGLAENTSMLAFLGSILVLHFGANKHVYPYFAFDDPEEPYDFRLTFIASSVTWACERVAALLLRAIIRVCFKVDPGVEGRLDLAVWPELLPACVAVILHVLQNMLFSIIRLHFH